jgi:hypothetical protein
MGAALGGLAITSCPEKKPVVTGMPTRGDEAAMRDEDLRRHAAAELCWDPQVGSEAIGVGTF